MIWQNPYLFIPAIRLAVQAVQLFFPTPTILRIPIEAGKATALIKYKSLFSLPYPLVDIAE
jgi:hypothetical protein